MSKYQSYEFLSQLEIFVCMKLEIQTLGSLTKTDKNYLLVVYLKVWIYYPTTVLLYV
jgi:hypothetical protein